MPSRRADLTARIGADDVGFLESPRRGLLKEISGIEPVAPGAYVRLDEHASVRSTQRLALGNVGREIVVAMWPAELKSQADYLYREGRGKAMVAAALQLCWDVRASPHLGFFNSRASQRLYMAPDIQVEEYAARWEGGDGRRIGQHSVAEVRQGLWPWLKERGYASTDDDPVLDRFLSILGRRPAHLRPAMRFRRGWDANEIDRLGRSELASAVRAEVNAILRAADEPTLPPN